jgi:tetratricopeptide (TPR) repeat protein
MFEVSQDIGELLELYQEQSFSADANASLSYRLAKLYLRNGDYERAEGAIRQILKKQPDNVAALVECANSQIKQNKLEEVVFLLERALELAPEYIPVYVVMSEYYGLIGDIAKQIHFLMVAANRAPEKYEIRFVVAEKLYRYGDLAGAEEQYRIILKAFPQLENAYFALGTLFLKQARVVEAVSCFKEILKNNPAAFDTHFNLANCFFRQKKYYLAINHFRFAMRKEEFVERSMYLIALCFHRVSDYDQAIVTMEKLCELNCSDISYQKSLGAFYEAANEFDMAIDIYKTLVASYPERADFYLSLAASYIEVAAFKEAEKTLSSLFKKHPGNLAGHKILGDLYFYMGEFKDAIEEYQRVLMFNDRFSGVYAGLARVYAKTNHAVKEQEALEKELMLGEETLELLFRLGELEMELKLPTYLNRFERLCELAPNTELAREAAYYIKHFAA